MQTILRYPNRKLYSTELSRYVNHEHLFGLIADDKTFVVIDSVTNEDVTSEILCSMAAKAVTDGHVLMSDVKLICHRAAFKVKSA